MAKADELRSNLEAAKERIEKIGRAQHHLGGDGGTLSTLTVKTTVCHQAAPSATNYWEDKNFDIALSAVVRFKFDALAAEAIAWLEREANDALIAEESDLRARLAQIESIKAKA